MGKFLVQIVTVCLGLILSAQAEPPVPSLDLQAPGPIESFGFSYSNSFPESPSRPVASSSSGPAPTSAPIQIAQQVPVQDSYQPAPAAAYPSQHQNQNQQVYYETIPSSSNQYYQTYQPQPQVVYGPPQAPAPTTTTTTQRPLIVYGPPAVAYTTTPRPPRVEYGIPPRVVFVPARFPLRTTTQNPIYLPPSPITTTTTTTTTQRPPVQGYSYTRPQGPQITYGPPKLTVPVSAPAPAPVSHQVTYHPQSAYTFVRPSRFSFLPNRFQYVPLTTGYGF